jgi:chromosome partitioning protein
MIVSVINQKGGTGKTTTSINLSSGLCQQGKKTLVIDIDPQANATTGLNYEVKQGEASIRDILENGVHPNEAIIETAQNGLKLIPSTIKLSVTAEQLYSKMFREAMLSKALKPINKQYDYIVIDCPPNLGVLTVNAIYASDFVIIPCETSRSSLDGINDLLNVLSLIKGKNFNNYRLLLTLVDNRNKITNEIVMDELADFQHNMFSTIIARNEALNQSQFAREDIFSFDPKSRGAQDYQNLTMELLQHEC